MLRYRADWRTLVWMTSSTALFFYLWQLDEFNWGLYVLYLYFSICFSVFAHNHNHLPVWRNKTLNLIHGCWITLFYGFPIFGWIPTHNQNHHRYNNKEEDYTKTYMWSEKNNLLTLITYPYFSGRTQQKAVFEYYRNVYRNNRQKFTTCTIQIVVLVSWIIFWSILDWRKALIYVILPQQVSLNVVLVFNYIQHVHADEESAYNHSRNIIGWPLNFLLFNNGLHTIHHEKPGLHWSKTPEAHKEIEHLIDPKLNEKSLMWFLFRVYVLGLFIPKFGTHSMRADRLQS